MILIYGATVYWHATRILYGLHLVRLKRVILSKLTRSRKFAFWQLQPFLLAKHTSPVKNDRVAIGEIFKYKQFIINSKFKYNLYATYDINKKNGYLC